MALTLYYENDAEGVADFAGDVVHAKGSGAPPEAILQMYAVKALTRYLQLAQHKLAEAAVAASD